MLEGVNVIVFAGLSFDGGGGVGGWGADPPITKKLQL